LLIVLLITATRTETSRYSDIRTELLLLNATTTVAEANNGRMSGSFQSRELMTTRM
jgi:hypothetical protein